MHDKQKKKKDFKAPPTNTTHKIHPISNNHTPKRILPGRNSIEKKLPRK